MKHLKKYLKGFTLVELVIVITILTILGTISFISFQDYFADARDANRVTTITNIENALALQKMKTRKFPTPANATSYTGGNTEILQGVINKEILPDMSNDPKDPLTDGYYTYSIFENGKYYQIASQLENQVAYKNFINTTYADDYESVKIVGNYKFDPSLPSLLVVPTSVTASGIFDPNVCFLLDGGKNNLTTCNEKKSQMSLKDYDKSLVGYWDMETLSGTKLKDLSGNGNDGTGSGGIIIGGTGGILGKSTYFDGTNLKKIIVEYFTGTSLQIEGKELTVVALVKQNNHSFTNQYSMILRKEGMYHLYTEKKNGWTGESYYTFSQYTNSGRVEPIRYNYPSKFNEFTLLIGKVDFNNQTYELFENGRKIRNESIQNYGTIEFNQFYKRELVIGGRKSTDGWEWNGLIDDIKIYNRALSDQEIAQQAQIAGF